MKLDYQSKHQLSVLLQDSLDFKMHVQSSLEFGIIEEGSCEFICSGRQYSLKPGDVYIAFPDQPHAYFGSQNLKAYLLLVPIKSFLRSFYSTLTKQVPKKAVLSTDEWDKSIHQVLKLAYKDAPTAAPVIMQGYLQIILGKLFNSLELVERCNTAEDALYKILVYINGNYREKLQEQISQKQLATTKVIFPICFQKQCAPRYRITFTACELICYAAHLFPYHKSRLKLDLPLSVISTGYSKPKQE